MLGSVMAAGNLGTAVGPVIGGAIAYSKRKLLVGVLVVHKFQRQLTFCVHATDAGDSQDTARERLAHRERFTSEILG